MGTNTITAVAVEWTGELPAWTMQNSPFALQLLLSAVADLACLSRRSRRNYIPSPFDVVGGLPGGTANCS